MGLGGIGVQELLLIFLLVLLLFGAKRLPEVGRNLGRGIREFKKATKEISSDVDLEEYEKKPPRKPAETREEPREGAGRSENAEENEKD